MIDLLKLNKNSSHDEVLKALKEDLRSVIGRIQATIEKRNARLVDTILSLKSKNIAVVYGGMHAEGTRALLEAKGLNCLLIEPVGYQNDETKLLRELEEAIH